MAGVRNRVMSAPVSATMTGGGLLDPGMVPSRSIWGRKGASARRCRRELLVVADSSSIRVRCSDTRTSGAHRSYRSMLDRRGSWAASGPAISAMTLRSSCPAISAASIARPETPRLSVATDEILIRRLKLLLQPLGFPAALDRQRGPVPVRARRWRTGRAGRTTPSQTALAHRASHAQSARRSFDRAGPWRARR